MEKHRGAELLDELRRAEEANPDAAGLDLADEIEGRRRDESGRPNRRDIDDAAPNLCKQVIRNALEDLALQDDGQDANIDLRSVLRQAMRTLTPDMCWSSPPRVGANANFSRLWQYVQEICDESWEPSGMRYRVINTRGPVPDMPVSPGYLRIRVSKI